MLGSGRGEALSAASLSLKGYYLVLVKPTIHVSTADAYAGVKPATPEHMISETLTKPVSEWKALLKNDFEISVFKKFPVIESIKNDLYECGALYASMSGSGASVFGIFKSKLERPSQFKDMEYWADYLS
jgi:4-diphosphocytidyl-2-C-methyl-D-erythritol kinase